MKKLLAIISLSLSIFFQAHAEDQTMKTPEGRELTLLECAQKNLDCDGRLPVDIGYLHVDPKLLSYSINLGQNCGFRISYFVANFKGHSKIRLPDGRVLDFGVYENTITQDYRYTIYTIRHGRDHEPCPLAGGWYPEDTTRQENIDKAYKMVKKSRF